MIELFSNYSNYAYEPKQTTKYKSAIDEMNNILYHHESNDNLEETTGETENTLGYYSKVNNCDYKNYCNDNNNYKKNYYKNNNIERNYYNESNNYKKNYNENNNNNKCYKINHNNSNNNRYKKKITELNSGFNPYKKNAYSFKKNQIDNLKKNNNDFNKPNSYGTSDTELFYCSKVNKNVKIYDMPTKSKIFYKVK